MKRYTQQQRQQVVRSIMSGDKTVEQAARKTGRSVSTINRWYREEAATVLRQTINALG